MDRGTTQQSLSHKESSPGRHPRDCTMSSLTYHPSPPAMPPTLETITSPSSPPTIASQYTHYTRPIFESGQPGSFHLTPSTLQQYLDCDCDNEHLELVDGLLVARPQITLPDSAYSLAHWLCLLLYHLPAEQRRKIHAYPGKLLLLSSNANANKPREETSIPQSPAQFSSSNAPAAASPSGDPRRRTERASSSTQRDTCRIPTFFVVATDEGSEASDAPISPFEQNLSRTPGWKKAIMVGEITSNVHMTDLETRLAEYEEEQIPECIVFGRHKLLKSPNPCVEVHKLQKHGQEKGIYTKRVYSGHEKVDCSFFKHWNLTANQILDYKYVGGLVEHVKREQEDAYEEAKERENAQKELEKAEKEREKAEKEREKAEKEWEEAEKESEKERKRADRVEEYAKKYKAHLRAFFKGERSTPPRDFELDESLFKIVSKIQSERREASKLQASLASPASRTSPRSPASRTSPRSPASSASRISPKSPASPPRRVRRVDASDVKTSLHKDEKSQRHGKK